MNRILVVDDDQSIRMLYDDELTEAGYKVFTLGDGSRLLDVIDKKRPDLVVLDVRLGRCNGLDLLQDIRKTSYDMPVILCAVQSNFKYDLRAIAADYYVTKQANLEELKLKIKMALEGSGLWDSEAVPPS